MKLRKLELEAADKATDNSPVTKKDIYRLLHAIESHKKIVFDRDKLSMYDFALYLAELDEYHLMTKTKAHRNGS